ncbi:zinc finger protein [Penicillium herquei]|nr:zinc finger protein [Penicillium herquei]
MQNFFQGLRKAAFKLSQDETIITAVKTDDQPIISAMPIGEDNQPVLATETDSVINISTGVIRCLRNFNHLVSEDLSSFESEVPQALWKDELGRLRVWAANIGAHQTGQSSLDYRLRDASHIKKQIIRILQRLQRLTEDIHDVLHNSLEDDDFLDLGADEDDDEPETAIQSIYHALRDTINNLFQMSMTIRMPAQHDRLIGTKRSDAVFYEHFDRQHVMAKYPEAKEDILNRLGLAISQRRAVMRYRERHHAKLGQGLEKAIDDGQSNKLSDTVATEFVKVPPLAKDDWESQTVASNTSYAQTILSGSEGIVLPPPPKDAADGALFECPYCFLVITISNRKAWARHVFNDLLPYLCVFPNCPTPHRLYESRREWFSHLQNQHSISDGAAGNMSCPLCLSSVSSGKQLERHIGRHLEELALFALPRSEEDDNEPPNSSDENSDDEELIEPDIIIGPDQQPEYQEALIENEDDDADPDIIAIRHRGAIYPLKYRAYSMHDGDLTVGQLRVDVAKLVGAESPDSIRLLYKGNLLRHDNQSCKAEGVKHHSEVLCVDTTRRVDSDDIDDDEPRAPFQSKDKSKVRSSQSPPGENEAKLPPALPSRHTSPTRPPNARTPSAPDLKQLRTPMEQVSALTIYLRRDITPLCEEFRSNPPSDLRKRDLEYRRLSETILGRVMLKVDGIEPNGDPIVRNARKILIKEAQALLNMLDVING